MVHKTAQLQRRSVLHKKMNVVTFSVYLDQPGAELRANFFKVLTQYSMSTIAQYTSSILGHKHEMSMQRRDRATTPAVFHTFDHRHACAMPISPTWSGHAGAQGL